MNDIQRQVEDIIARLDRFERFQDMPLHEKDLTRLDQDQDPMERIDDFLHSPKPDWRIFKGIVHPEIHGV